MIGASVIKASVIKASVTRASVVRAVARVPVGCPETSTDIL